MTKASNGTFAGTPQLTVWHEAGSFYGDTYSQYGVVRGTQTTINGTRLDAAQIVRSTHVKMQELCNQQATTYYWLPRVEYGCIIYGDIDKMASDTDPTQNYVPGIPPFPPNTRYPMDWYGIDVYYEDDTQWGSTTNTHGNLDSDGAISNYMGPFATMARSRGGSGARINVTECNASLANEGSRPWFFEHLAKWLYNNGGYRMLTFFTDTPPAHHSVTWEHVADASPAYTIDALNSIVATYG